MSALIFRLLALGIVVTQLCIDQKSLAGEAKSEIIPIDAKPEPISIDPIRTAVIVVDMENDFAAKGGMFDRAGVDISGAQKAIAPTAKVLAAARQAGLKIIYL